MSLQIPLTFRFLMEIKFFFIGFFYVREARDFWFLQCKFQKQRTFLQVFFLAAVKTRYTALQVYLQRVACVTERLLYNKGLLYYKVVSSLV